MTSSGGQFSGYLNEINRLKQKKEMMLKSKGLLFDSEEEKEPEPRVFNMPPSNSSQYIFVDPPKADTTRNNGMQFSMNSMENLLNQHINSKSSTSDFQHSVQFTNRDGVGVPSQMTDYKTLLTNSLADTNSNFRIDSQPINKDLNMVESSSSSRHDSPLQIHH